jgi:hypothetical protein
LRDSQEGSKRGALAKAGAERVARPAARVWRAVRLEGLMAAEKYLLAW